MHPNARIQMAQGFPTVVGLHDVSAAEEASIRNMQEPEP